MARWARKVVAYGALAACGVVFAIVPVPVLPGVFVLAFVFVFALRLATWPDPEKATPE